MTRIDYLLTELILGTNIMIYLVVVYSVIGMIRNYVFQVSGKRKDDNLIGNKQNMDAYNMFEVNGLLS